MHNINISRHGSTPQRTRKRSEKLQLLILPCITLCGLITLISPTSGAITIEEMAEKNNKILELDQDIVIAEKNKKLAQLHDETFSSQTILLPQIVPTNRNDNIFVLSVHGSPSNPIVDVRYDGMLLHKRRGEALPDGWKITSIGNNAVTFNKKVPAKPDIIKTVSIGHGLAPTPEHSTLPEELITHPKN